MGGYKSHSDFYFFGKSSQNSPKPVLIFWNSIPCVFCIDKSCLLLHDLSILSMSVMCFQKKSLDGWGELYPNFVWIF